MHFAAFCGAAGYQWRRKPREYSASMALPYPFSGASRLRLGRSVPIALVAIALCGCSINLGSFSSEPENEAPKAAPGGASATEALAATTRGQALARSGKTEEALSEFD